MSSPEQIQREIEQTRSQLSGDVDRLTEKVTPSRVVSRRVDRVKGGVGSLRDRVMGSSQGNGSGLRGAGGSVSSVAGSAKDAAGSAKETVAGAPQAVRSQAQGNPLAAGLIAFGVGMLVSSLAPASQAEQNLASNAESKAKELAEPLKQTGQQVAQDLKEPVQNAVQEVKSTATDAAGQTVDHAKGAAQDVKQQASTS